jgi:hypothetical protein
MAVREFDGTGDYIACGGTGTAIATSAYSVIAIAKPSRTTDPNSVVGLSVGTSTLLGGLHFNGTDKLAVFTSSDFTDQTGTGLVTGVWQILAMSKPSGTANVTFSRKALGSGSWTHLASSSTLDNEAGTCTRVEFGGFQGAQFGSDYQGRIATVALYDSALSTANIETAQTTPSTQQLADLGAIGVWDLNQASTATPVEDLVGTADEASLVGTSVVGGDDPSGWTFGLGADAPSLFLVQPNRRLR